MKTYFTVSVEIVVEAETASEAADAVAETLREGMSFYSDDGCFVDWRYTDGTDPMSAETVVLLPAWVEPQIADEMEDQS